MAEDRLDQLDYYTLLRIEPGASADEIRDAFHRFALRYHPDRFVTAAEEKRLRAGQIYRRGAEAYRVLTNHEARRRYDAGLGDGKLRLEPEARRFTDRAPSSNRLTVRSPRARPFATKALQAFRAGEYRTAKLNLQMALRHEPGNALLEARLAEVEERLARDG